MSKFLSLKRFLPHLLFIFMGYCIADITILTVRDKMLPTQPPPSRTRSTFLEQGPAVGNYNSVKTRNILSSSGKIPDPLHEEKDTPAGDSAPVASSLPLNLVGTIVHTNPTKSIANIEFKSKNLVTPYTVGEDIEGLAKLITVERGKAIIRNTNNNRLEFIEMKIFTTNIVFQKGEADTSSPYKVGETHFKLARTEVNRLTSDLPTLLQQAAMAPRRNVNGEIDCFRFLDIQPGSIYTKLGFQRGDCIKSVNGEKIDSPAKAMELYNALKTSNNIKLTYEREGRDVENDYAIE